MISLQRGVQHFPRGGPTSSRWGGGGGGGFDFLGGSGPPIPPLNPHKGSPDATVMVNQNLNEK